MTTTASVRVYLNETGGLTSYEAGDLLTLALEFETPLPACRSMDMLLEIIWRQLNFIGEMPSTPWGRRYFGWTEDGQVRTMSTTHRSLCMGDIVVLGETAWTPVVVGWRRVTDLVLTP
jgi:hypothetical protein